MLFYRQLKHYRTQAGLTQAELANQLHVSRKTISNWENQRSFPNLEMLTQLSARLNVSTDQLLRQPNQSPQPNPTQSWSWIGLLAVSLLLACYLNLLSIYHLPGITLLFLSTLIWLRYHNESMFQGVDNQILAYSSGFFFLINLLAIGKTINWSQMIHFSSAYQLGIIAGKLSLSIVVAVGLSYLLYSVF
ncbi:helix-turn-helix domain-containing protein [Fructilactobacillus cliffordii]|uniref:helix-turn-helix domain-containing protein n=1 Tax=Fructilactobacillus cliffordii TaxID=2940299 RepID=UPI002093DC43|nr:helix-turn-helix transcriptional regulator [Fructilactobacillus cliffordii]USS86350.1 helix-turn-helix domain-containing protein [Fructilactobacillus cliffordii]